MARAMRYPVCMTMTDRECQLLAAARAVLSTIGVWLRVPPLSDRHRTTILSPESHAALQQLAASVAAYDADDDPCARTAGRD